MTYICLLQIGLSNISESIDKAALNNYSAIATSINANMLPFEPTQFDPSYPDTAIKSSDWSDKIILMLSENIDCDAQNKKFRARSQKIFAREKSWSEHLQAGGCIMINLRKAENTFLAMQLTKLKGTVLMRVPLTMPSVAAFEFERDTTEKEMLQAVNEDTWKWWHDFRNILKYNQKIKLVLDFTYSECPDENALRRWLAEPIEAILLPTNLFIRNRKNFPVLPKAMQTVVRLFLQMRVNVIISTNQQDDEIKYYADYMLNLINNYRDTMQLKTFEDLLEIPLQPLSDNLDCYTYEIFEKDPIKYKNYQLAIQQALLDRVPEEKKSTDLTIVMVLGAGRGPLVRAVFNAAEFTERKVRVYIIEKNPNAIRTLSNMVKDMWHNKDVHIFSKDMREFQPPEFADIFVSELLGSFSDNELAPECLDGALRLLKPDGISIPCKSTSYINPIMAPKLYQCLQEQERITPNAYDYGFVVLLKSIFHIDKPKELFDFIYPNRELKVDNTRFQKILFKAPIDCVLHGLAGYFDTVLYKNITLSIHPETHTKGLFSWFPMFFPLHPVEIKKDDLIEVNFWRYIEPTKVWYEWSITNPIRSKIHNKTGNGYYMSKT